MSIYIGAIFYLVKGFAVYFNLYISYLYCNNPFSLQYLHYRRRVVMKCFVNVIVYCLHRCLQNTVLPFFIKLEFQYYLPNVYTYTYRNPPKQI